MIILTTLGLGPFDRERNRFAYTEETYQWDGRQQKTALFQAALAEWFPGAAMIVLATEKARRERGEELMDAVPNACLVDIPDGRSDAEFWQIFNTVAETIPTGEPVVLDITHGLRSLPMLALLSLSFLRVAKNVELTRVLYGALDAKDESGSVPVFDLTPFVKMLDWANATDRFMETGDARKIAPLIHEKRKNPLNPVAQGMEELSNALALLRAEQILKSADSLKRRITAVRGEVWEPQHAPLKLLLDRIETRFSPMADSAPLQAQWEQIRWLSSHGHYPAAAALAREWLVSVRVVTEGGAIFPVSNEGRDAAEDWLNNRDKEVPIEWKQVLELWVNLGDLRNDLMHFGMRQSPKRPLTIQEQGRMLPEKLCQAVKPLGIEVGE